MKTKIAIVGSGLSALGAVSGAIKQRSVEIDLYEKELKPDLFIGECNLYPELTEENLPLKFIAHIQQLARKYKYDPKHNFANDDRSRFVPPPLSVGLGGQTNVWGAAIRTPDVSEAFVGGKKSEVLRRHLAALRNELPIYEPKTVSTSLELKLAQASNEINGVTAARAILAVGGTKDCNSCGRCLLGCPRELVFSASDYLNNLAKEGRITLYRGRGVVALEAEGNSCIVVDQEGRKQKYEHVFFGNWAYPNGSYSFQVWLH